MTDLDTTATDVTDHSGDIATHQVVSPSPLKARAQELLTARLDALDDVEATRARADRARAELDAANQAHTTAWVAATTAGWTVTELTSLGLTAPSSAARPTRQRPTRTVSARRGRSDVGSSTT